MLPPCGGFAVFPVAPLAQSWAFSAARPICLFNLISPFDCIAVSTFRVFCVMVVLLVASLGGSVADSVLDGAAADLPGRRPVIGALVLTRRSRVSWRRGAAASGSVPLTVPLPVARHVCNGRAGGLAGPGAGTPRRPAARPGGVSILLIFGPSLEGSLLLPPRSGGSRGFG